MRFALALIVLASADVVLAQQPTLRVAGFTQPTLPSLAPWGSETLLEDENAAFEFAPDVEGFTLFFAHTTIDDSIAGAHTARALVDLYPFLAPPEETWKTDHETFASLPPGSLAVTPQALAIPPARVVAQLQRFLAANPADRNQFGAAPNGTAATVLQRSSAWVFGTPVDERQPWSGTWTDDPPRVVDVSAVGRRALTMAAHQAVPEPDLPGMDAINDLIEQEYGFRIHVQAATVSWPEGQVRIRFSQSVVMRRRSLREIEEDDRRLELGALPWIASMFDPNHRVHFGGRGAWLWLEFSHSVEGTIAIVETTSGWVECPQVANPPCLADTVGRYRYPLSGISGFAYAALPLAGGGYLPLFPLHTQGGGAAATVLAFDPHAEHVPPNPPQ